MDIKNTIYNYLIKAAGSPYKGPPTVLVTKPYIKEVYYLLILNGYNSYTTLEFNKYYIKNYIITLYILVYILYLL